MSLVEWLATREDRCVHGWHVASQGCVDCGVALKFKGQASDEWAVFVAALKQAAVDGLVSQSKVRPLIRGRIAPKHIGQQYKRAVREGVLVERAPERSDDELGKNAGRWEPTYELRSAA